MNKYSFIQKRFFFSWALAALFALSVTAQPTAKPAPILKDKGTGGSAEVIEQKLDSKLMARAMPYRVLTPKDYKNNVASRYAVIYLLHGLTGHYTNWTDKTELAEYAFNHQFIIVTSEGDNGWYTDSVATPNDKYESYIIKELIPEIDKKFRTIADRDHRMIAGLSMGGYGAIKFGLKYPEMFSLVGSFSGAVWAASYNAKNAGDIGKGIDVVLGADDSEARRANDVFKMVRELTPERLKAAPFIYLSCGTEDFIFQSSRDFNALLIEKKIPHEYREHSGIHDWVFWNDQVREFLDVAERRMAVSGKR